MCLGNHIHNVDAWTSISEGWGCCETLRYLQTVLKHVDVALMRMWQVTRKLRSTT